MLAGLPGGVSYCAQLFSPAIESRDLEEAEIATIAVARSLGRVPCELTQQERSSLIDTLGESQTEMVVHAMCAMGYLNKVMDSIGVELEEEQYLRTRTLVDMDCAASKHGAMLDAQVFAVSLSLFYDDISCVFVFVLAKRLISIC